MQIFNGKKSLWNTTVSTLDTKKNPRGFQNLPPILKRGPSRCKCDHFCLVASVPFLFKNLCPLRLLLVIYEPVGKIKWNGFHPVDGGNFLLLQQISICAWSSRGGRKKKSQDVDQSALFHLARSGAWLKQGPAIERPGN
jgi:hypothetical protein